MDPAAEASELRATVAKHNAAIRQHRKDRREAQRRLAELTQHKPQHSKGAVHGRTER